MVSCHSGNVQATQVSTELAQGRELLMRLPAGDSDYAGQSTLRALLLLAGGTAATDAALGRASENDVVCFTNIVGMLGRSAKSTHAA